MILLDTSVAIDTERTKGLRATSPFAIATVTLSEFLAGPYLAKKRATRARIRREVKELMATARILPFDAAVARVHARLRARLIERGKEPPGYDLIIAATAVAHGCALATLN